MDDRSWQAVPAQGKVTELCEKLGIDPTDLSPLGDVDDMLA